MKKSIIAIVSLFFIIMFSSGCSKVPAGYAGVKVYLLGGDKGVSSEVLPVGRYWIGINEELYLFPLFTQNYVWTKDPTEGSPNDESITFQTKEGMSVGVDIGISYRVEKNKVSSIFEKYRKGVDEITDIFLRNMVRDAFVTIASSKPVESVYGEGKEDLIKNVEVLVKKQVDDIGIVIEKIYYVGDMRLPPQVLKALNMKIEATQRAQQRENEIRESEAEAKKLETEARGIGNSTLIKAKSIAQANKIVNESLTGLLVEYEKVKKWNGELPQISGGNTISMIDLKAKPKSE